MPTPFILLDDALAPPEQQRSRRYTGWQHTDTLNPEQLQHLDTLLQQGWAKGWHVVLLAPYEFGTHLTHTPAHPDTPAALKCLWFDTCTPMNRDTVTQWLTAQDTSNAPTGLLDLAADTDQTRFTQAIHHIQDLIRAGDTYQVNYTHRWQGRLYGNPLALYRALRTRQPVPFGTLAHLDDGQWILSLSPELFLRHDGTGKLETQPMKGTAPLEQAPHTLAQDPKNQAENLMIVDLLRNDLGRIAQTGSVHVQDLFTVRSYGPVWQMTSTVTAQMRPETTHAQLLAALFPCGSITGAPKRRTMEIIHQIETSPRGLYTGAIGWLEPASRADTQSGTSPRHIGPFCLSVAIRTLIAAPKNLKDLSQTHPCQIGIGSGITYDSNPEDEYAECQWKARFFTQHDPGFALIETLKVQIENGASLQSLPHSVPHLAAHLQRLTHSAHQLGFRLDLEHLTHNIKTTLESLPPFSPGTIGRLRLLLHKTGQTDIRFAPLPPLPHQANQPVKLVLAPQILPEQDPLRRHKTTHRPHYDQGWQDAEQQGAFDSLFFNAQHQLLEGGRTSIFVKINGTWLTPPLTQDILPGIMRAHILAHQQHLLDAPAREAIITRTQLAQAEAILAVNALRGIMPARLIPPSE